MFTCSFQYIERSLTHYLPALSPFLTVPLPSFSSSFLFPLPWPPSPSLSSPSCSYDKAIQEVADSEAKREVAEKELRLVSPCLPPRVTSLLTWPFRAVLMIRMQCCSDTIFHSEIGQDIASRIASKMTRQRKITLYTNRHVAVLARQCPFDRLLL